MVTLLRRKRVTDIRSALGAYWAETLLALMLVASAAAILCQDRLLVERLDWSPKAVGGVGYAYDDRASGGASVSRADPRRPLAWRCRLAPGFAYPYCGYELLVDPTDYAKGVDLSRFESVTIRLLYRGPADRLSIYLKNHDARYGLKRRMDTNKPDRLDLLGRQGRITVRAKLADFSVAEWWLSARRLKPALAAPQFDNVVSVSVQTGPAAPPGSYAFAIERITFKRILLSEQQFYGALLAAWGLVLSLLLVSRIVRQRREWRRRIAAGLQIEEALRRSHDRAHNILDSIPQMIWEADRNGRSTYRNRQWHEFTGTPRDETTPSLMDCLHPDDRAAAWAQWQASVAEGRPFEAEHRLRHRDGDYRWCISRVVPHRDSDGEIDAWYGTSTDVHERILAQHALRESEALNRSIFEASPDCIAVMDLDGRILDLNEAGQRSGRVRDHFGARLVAAGGMRDGSRQALAAAQAGRIGRFTYKERGAGGKWWDVLVAPLRTGDGKPEKLVSIARDISQQKEAEERAYWVANHDPLTGLPNRKLMQQSLERAVQSASRDSGSFALLLVDVDDFKRVNDMFGHDGGDALLCAFAERLKSCLRTEDHVFRLGGDEFALILGGAASDEDVHLFSERMFRRLAEPCIHAGRMLDLRASAGAALWAEHGRSRSELMKNADIALYAAKAAGRKTMRLFAPAMRDEVQRRASMLSLARSALHDRRILPFYQPKVELGSRRVVGFEALLRWEQPERGIQPPASIAAAFEDAALAAEISDRMIDCVIADIRRWRERGIAFGQVAINASAAEFRRGDFAERLLSRLDVAELPASLIQLEVTESVFVGRGAECVERALKRLSNAGMQIALDDFGTGYASLSHLQQFPVDTIKIDQSFVRGLTGRGGNHAIIDAVLGLGRSLGIDVVAEGIETEAQEQALLRLRCRYGQGYLYGRAVPAGEVGPLVASAAGRDVEAA